MEAHRSGEAGTSVKLGEHTAPFGIRLFFGQPFQGQE
jgi:hypothetical protein